MPKRQAGLFMLNLLLLLGCLGGSDSSNSGWVKITYPTNEDIFELPDYQATYEIGGEAFSVESTTRTECVCPDITLMTCIVFPFLWQCSDIIVEHHAKISIINTTMNADGVIDVHGENWSGSIPLTIGENIILAKAEDNNGNHGSDILTIIANDTSPPTIPSKVVAESKMSSLISLSWFFSTDNHLVKKYRIYRDDVFLQDLDVTEDLSSLITMMDKDPIPSALHCYHATAVDASNNESDNSLKSCASTLWNSIVDQFDHPQPFQPSIALDVNNKANIIYSAPQRVGSGYIPGPIKYAQNISGQWEIVTIDDNSTYPNETYPNPSLTIDEIGFMHIIYCKQGFYYRNNLPGIWDTSSVNVPCEAPSFSLDKDGNIHVIDIIDNGDGTKAVQYLTNASGSWTTTDIETGLGVYSRYNSIALDQFGYIHITYNDNGKVKYATNSTGQWVITVLDDTYTSPSSTGGPSVDIAFDSLNIPHIIYSSSRDYALKHALLINGFWEINVVSQGSASLGNVTLVIDAQDKLHIGYKGCSTNATCYATNVAGQWQNYSITNGLGGIYTDLSSIALDRSGRVHFARHAYEGYEVENRRGFLHYSIFFLD